MSKAGADNPHAPAVGRVARLLGPFHVTGVFWYRFHLWGARVAPFWMRSVLVRLFTWLFFLVLRNIRGAIASNLEAVLGTCGWFEAQRRIYRTMHEFAWCITERYERFALGDMFDLQVENPEIWSELSAEGKGFIMLTGHVGNWEVGSVQPSALEGRRMHVVREEEMNPTAQEFISGLLQEQLGGLYTTHFASRDPRLGLLLLEALKRGEIVALQADRPRRGGRTEPVQLFGRPYELPVGPVALARAAEVPLVPVFVLREGRFKYRVVFRPPLVVSPTADRADALRELAQTITGEIEWAIRERPHQWFCFRRLWP